MFIDVNVVFEGDVTLGDNVRIGMNNLLRDSRIGAGTNVRANCHIEGATLISNRELADRLSEVDGTGRILVYCREGTRSLEAIRLLYASGYTSVRHLKGGILAWIDEIDPSLARY